MTRTISSSDYAALAKRKGGRIRVTGKDARTYKGVVYHSKAEALQAQSLDILVKCGNITKWERQVPFPLMVNGKHICTMVVDFRITTLDDKTFLMEVKGMETAEYKLKFKLFRALFPDEDYRVVKA